MSTGSPIIVAYYTVLRSYPTFDGHAGVPKSLHLIHQDAQDEEDEGAVVVPAHAIAHHRAVVVKFGHASAESHSICNSDRLGIAGIARQLEHWKDGARDARPQQALLKTRQECTKIQPICY